MKLILSIFAFLFVAFTSYARTPEETAALYSSFWAQEKLIANDLDYYVNTEDCIATKQIFYGCFKGVETVVALATDKNILVLRNSPRKPWETAVVKEFQFFEVRQVDISLFPRNRSFEERQAQVQEMNRLRTQISDLASLDASSDLIAIKNWALPLIQANKYSEAIARSIEGFFVYGVDAHAHIHTEKELQDMNTPEANSSRFFGIGAVLTHKEDYVFVESVTPNSPAARSGIKPGNKIIAVNNLSVVGRTLEDVVTNIRGPENTVVTLTVRNKAGESQIEITRGPVVTENLTATIATDHQNRKALYVKLNSFSEQGICKKFVNTIASQLNQEKINSLIVDLRGNGGGLLNEVLCMAGALYRKDGVLLKTWSLERNRFDATVSYDFKSAQIISSNPLQRYNSETNISSLLKGRPIVVLINARSASASEIFAGIIQDQQLGITVGERSFGKGTVQQPVRFKTNYASLVMFRTIQRFHLPTERTNQLSGITADVEVYRSPNPTEEDKFALRERDLFPHAVAEARNDYQTPSNFKAKATACLQKVNIENLYTTQMEAEDYADYQWMTAVELSTCL